MNAKGLLFALAEPGDALKVNEWHAWYDEEHVPLRTALLGFQSATRFIQADGKKPTWAALYDVDDVDVLKSDAYLQLLKTQSERERDVMGRMAYFERRVYTLNEIAPTTVNDKFAGYGVDSDVEGKAGVLLAVSMDVPPEYEESFHRWYGQEHIPMLSKIPGWLRSRRFILAESSITAGSADALGPYKSPPRFLAVHDFASTNGLGGPEHTAAASTPWRNETVGRATSYEKRLWNVYRTF